MKPERGGRPPSESKTRGRSAVRAGAFVQVVARELMLRALFSLSARKADIVMAK